MNSPELSVCMITYNHAKYAKEAIEGVLKQNTNFEFELIIGEDFSTDNTRKICEDYQQKFPAIVKLLPSEQNLGMSSNFIRSLHFCNGRYIAFCEGDDYWTSPDKLQKQVDFLENNPDFSMCFHKVHVSKDNSFTPFTQNVQFISVNESRIVEPYEILLDWIVPTASVVFRSSHFDPDILHNKSIVYGDIIVFLSLALKGKVYFMNEDMAVYRVLDSGASIVSFNRILNNDMSNHYKFIRSTLKDKGVFWAATYHICRNLIYLLRYHFIKTNFREFNIYLKQFKVEIKYLNNNLLNETFQIACNDMNCQYRSLKKELFSRIFSKKFLSNLLNFGSSKPLPA